MNREQNGEGSQSQLVTLLLKLAGSRPAIPADAMTRVHSMVHAHWKRTVRIRLMKRWSFISGLTAATLLLLFATALYSIQKDAPASVPLGFVENLNGVVHVRPEKQSPQHSLKKGEFIVTGTQIATGNSGRMLVHLLGGRTLRLDRHSQLSVKPDFSIVLDYGTIYLDSAKSNAPLALFTPMGTVRDIGTQFEVRVREEGICIRVREGLVSLDRDGFSRPAAEGTELAVDKNGKATVKNIDRFGPQWSWISEIGPTFHMDGKTLNVFLEWITRENGWRLQFAEPSILQRAKTTVLRGSIIGLTPEETPAVVLPVCGLDYTLAGGVLTVKQPGPS
jgi:FecR-like protein